jgi:hypothetical protein
LAGTIHGKGVLGSVDERWDYSLELKEKPGKVDEWIRVYSVFVKIGALGWGLNTQSYQYRAVLMRPNAKARESGRF